MGIIQFDIAYSAHIALELPSGLVSFSRKQLPELLAAACRSPSSVVIPLLRGRYKILLSPLSFSDMSALFAAASSSASGFLRCQMDDDIFAASFRCAFGYYLLR